jgi:protein TonB
LRTPPSAPAEQLSPNELRETLGRLSETMLFPPEALERGLEGEVTLLVQLGENGRILDASIASGSGYQILDAAAVRAVLKLGTLGPSSANKSILLPVRFRIL